MPLAFKRTTSTAIFHSPQQLHTSILLLLFFPFPTWKKKLSVYEALCHVPFPSFTNVAPTFRAMEYIYMYDRLQVESCIVLEISGVSLWKMNVHLGCVTDV